MVSQFAAIERIVTIITVQESCAPPPYISLKFVSLAGKVNAKQVCEALLGGLSFQLVEYWVQALSLIEQLLPQVDYKGVRDLLKLLFDKVSW